MKTGAVPFSTSKPFKSVQTFMTIFIISGSSPSPSVACVSGAVERGSSEDDDLGLEEEKIIVAIKLSSQNPYAEASPPTAAFVHRATKRGTK